MLKVKVHDFDMEMHINIYYYGSNRTIWAPPQAHVITQHTDKHYVTCPTLME